MPVQAHVGENNRKNHKIRCSVPVLLDRENKKQTLILKIRRVVKIKSTRYNAYKIICIYDKHINVTAQIDLKRAYVLE